MSRTPPPFPDKVSPSAVEEYTRQLSAWHPPVANGIAEGPVLAAALLAHLPCPAIVAALSARIPSTSASGSSHPHPQAMQSARGHPLAALLKLILTRIIHGPLAPPVAALLAKLDAALLAPLIVSGALAPATAAGLAAGLMVDLLPPRADMPVSPTGSAVLVLLSTALVPALLAADCLPDELDVLASHDALALSQLRARPAEVLAALPHNPDPERIARLARLVAADEQGLVAAALASWLVASLAHLGWAPPLFAALAVGTPPTDVLASLTALTTSTAGADFFAPLEAKLLGAVVASSARASPASLGPWLSALAAAYTPALESLLSGELVDAVRAAGGLCPQLCISPLLDLLETASSAHPSNQPWYHGAGLVLVSAEVLAAALQRVPSLAAVDALLKSLLSSAAGTNAAGLWACSVDKLLSALPPLIEANDEGKAKQVLGALRMVATSPSFVELSTGQEVLRRTRLLVSLARATPSIAAPALGLLGAALAAVSAKDEVLAEMETAAPGVAATSGAFVLSVEAIHSLLEEVWVLMLASMQDADAAQHQRDILAAGRSVMHHLGCFSEASFHHLVITLVDTAFSHLANNLLRATPTYASLADTQLSLLARANASGEVPAQLDVSTLGMELAAPLTQQLAAVVSTRSTTFVERTSASFEAFVSRPSSLLEQTAAPGSRA
ncbi:uncharacterized protein AMSG_09199 [Thecamonas trahens ATCC 50062]|uniref:Uncharacterized protein n=1 Tax=Thecamonas trahens ATCC 50062 TaxID=461836 RepID=A0A0L0DNM2_THETB|nr:hypothetical protein AMSG_09199 [Thecamonas trahens ATCC 50062]KNC53018.1 hypothetical protein AMSG_09199 [Thecamonas trahens ATCC 50062]|eukprot:XP_013754904.1 hypothetical protein AMSG_09199 [Thecamonas trahens ATCC 50062]